MFYERLQILCKEHHTSVSTMLQDLGLSTGCTGNWKRGQLPKGDVLVKIADYLGTSIDYIVFGEYRDDLSQEERTIISLFRTLPERKKYKVFCDFELLIKNELN
ncbi:MAG: hypothetical protein IJ060_09480 [Oscillospiraceae bacterium]|nr:hypothetical protein [Oscillospiraceae bacterium]